MSNQVKGEIHEIGETQTFDSGFSKRICVVKYQDGDYENFLAVEFLKDKCGVLEGYNVGQNVIIDYNIRSNENKNKPGMWFTNAAAWKIALDGEQPAPAQPGNTPEEMVNDDIPF